MSTILNKGLRRVDSATPENKSLMIVKAQSQSLTGVESFLRNRDWKLYSTTSLKDALTYMIQNQPAFVMISVDHPNKKVRNLSRVLAQAFPCCVMMFAEQSAAASFKMLSDSKAEYLLYPPVTGPAVERTVNKYYKDQATKAAAPVGERSMGEGGGDSMISIKGGGVSAQSLLAQLMNEDAGGGVISGDVGSAENGTNFMQGSGADQDKNATNFNPNHVGHYNPQGDTSQLHPSHHNNQDVIGKNGSLHHNPQGARGENDPTHHNPQLGKDLGPGQGYRPPGEGLDDQGNPYQPNMGSGGPGGWQALDPKNKAKPGLPTDDELSKPTRQQQDSIILKGTKDALEKSVIRSAKSMEEVQTVQDSSNVACIVIESTRFSGYLVAAMGKNRTIDDEFIDRIRDKLFKFLNDNGEKVKSEDGSMQMKIKQVPFEDWAVECAEFLRKSVHKGDEVAMAFFPHSNVKAHFEESANNDMLAVSLDDLQAEVPVEFDLYVYLPANQKYVLYTPRGGKLYGKQKDKLSRQGVSHMHMMKNDVQDFNKYRAQNYLNGKIEEFENKQKIEQKINKASA